jgi:hypothetical protein
MKYYRVCHKDTHQGLWYDYKGGFTGLIHDKFNFCKNNQLRMDFDEEIVGWLSATDSLDTLFHWFTKEDIIALQEHGWFIHEFEASDVKFYERFQHVIIKQETSKVLSILDVKTIMSNLEIAKTLGFIKWYSDYSEKYHDLKGWIDRDEYLDEVELPSELMNTLIHNWLMDDHKIRIYPTYAANGSHGFEIRKGVKDDWKMERIGHIGSYDTFDIAMDKGISEALKLVQSEK